MGRFWPKRKSMELPGDIRPEREMFLGKIVRLLVVDDEEYIRTIIRERLEIEGFLVDEAKNGRQALAKLGMRDYSILLTDIRMPEMDGIALIREATNRFPRMSRIVMTAYGELETAITALNKGAFDYILKPFSFDALIITIRNALRKQALERQLRDYQSSRETKVKEQTEVINSMYIRSIKHHERIDGSGYPKGLVRREIPPYARILSIADAYDAMTSDRAYRPAFSGREAMTEIRRLSRTQFDPEIVSVFFSVVEQFHPESESFTADLHDAENPDDDRWSTV